MDLPKILLPGLAPDALSEYERDREYLRELYPAKARIVMALIEKECDKLEYENSPMYARYPDREGLTRIASVLAKRLSADEELSRLILILFLNECGQRRDKYRRRRSFYQT